MGYRVALSAGGIWPEQGGSVALSGNAKVGAVGSNGQDSRAGAFWIFTP